MAMTRREYLFLGDDAVAKCDSVRGVLLPFVNALAVETWTGSGEILVGRPGTGTMIHNDVVRAGRDAVHFPAASLLGAGFSGPDTDMLDDHIMGLVVNAASDECNAGAGRRLTVNRQEWFRDGYRILLKIDHAAHFEDDDPGALHLNRCRKRTGTARLEVRDADDLSSPTAGRIGSPTHSIREGLDWIGEENFRVE